MTAPERSIKALNRLCKWRMILCGWQIGTRSDTDPTAQAIRDHINTTLCLRAEVSALTNLLIAKKVFTEDEFHTALTTEADYLCQAYERKFPGAEATDNGMKIDSRASEWMSKFPR